MQPRASISSGKPRVAYLSYNDGAAIWGTEKWRVNAAQHDILGVSWYRSIPKIVRQSWISDILQHNPNCKIVHYVVPGQAYDSGDDAQPNLVVDGEPATSRIAKLTAEDWWLFKQEPKISANRVDGLGANTGQPKAVNDSSFANLDSKGRSYAQWFARAIDGMDRLDGSAGWLIDNVVSKRDSGMTGLWNPEGPSAVWTAVEREIRAFYRQFLDELNRLFPGGIVLGNLDQHSLDYLSWNRFAELSGRFDGGYVERGIGGYSFNLSNQGADPFLNAMTHYKVEDENSLGFTIMAGSPQLDGSLPVMSILQAMRLTLCAAHMRNGYSAFFPTGNYSGSYWYDEYDQYIGHPVDLVQEAPHPSIQLGGIAPTLWMRRFEHAVFLCNGSKTTPQIVNYNILGPGYRRIDGIQDRVVNNGALITGNFILQPYDGLLLIKA